MFSMWEKISTLGGNAGQLVFKISDGYTAEPMKQQRELLTELMTKNANTEYGKLCHFSEVRTLEDYQRLVPLAEYSDFQPYIERMLKGEQGLLIAEKIKHYLVTSGSIGKPKYIPITLRGMINTYYMGLLAPLAVTKNWYEAKGEKLPAQRSFITLELENRHLEHGFRASYMSAVPFRVIRPFARFFSSSPVELLFPKGAGDADMTYLKLLFALSNPRITALCAALITYIENMFEALEKLWPQLCDDIEKGKISQSVKCPAEYRKKLERHLKPDAARADFLRAEFEKGFDTPIAPRIWPELAWTSAMRGGDLARYAEKLKKYTGDLPYNNTTLIASESIMAMGLEMSADDGVLLPKSVLFEFLPVDEEASRPLFLDEIEVGKRYEVIITNVSGLYRYKMHDVIECTGFHQKTPKVKFLFRNNLVLNKTGEKTTQSMVDWALKNACGELGISVSHFCVFTSDDAVPAYTFLMEKAGFDPGSLAAALDKYLGETNLYYKARREIDVLAPARVCFLEPGTFDAYREHLRDTGINLNQIKPVTILNTPEKLEYFTSKIIGK